MRAFLVSSVCVLGFVFGCGDDTSTGAGGTGGSGATGGSGTGASTTQGGGGQNSGGGGNAQGGAGGGTTVDLSECNSDTDCPGGTCVEVVDGYRLCQAPVPEATMCGKNGLDECCTSADCMNGAACYLGPLVPFCGGIIPQAFNQCGSDECATDADCAGGACMPAGTVGNAIATCVPSECGAGCGAGQDCALVRDPCCNGPAGFFCVDPTNGCQSNDDCPGGYCEAGTCMAGAPLCPA